MFRQFVQDYKRLYDKEPPSEVYFHQIWRKHCKHVKVRRLTRFAKCSRCEQLRREIEIALKSNQDTTELRRQKKAHLDLVQAERREYRKKREKAIINSQHVCSIIVDGADQSAFGLPHFTVKSKDSRGNALKVKLV